MSSIANTDSQPLLQEIKKGYKQTDIGVIPEDWEVALIKDSFEICNTLRLPINRKLRERMQGKYPYYGPTKIQDHINEFRIEGEYALIGEDGDHFLKYKKMAQTQLTKGRFNVNNHAHLIKGKKNLTEWFYFFFQSRDISLYLTRQGAGRFKLSKGSLEILPCVLPPVTEQRKINSALSDVDALIQSLQTLIAKKRAIKIATMQQLLTGKTRLPPFDQTHTGYKQTELGEIPEDWEIEHLSFLFEQSLNRKSLKKCDDVIFIEMQDVSEESKIKSYKKVHYDDVKSGFTYFEKNDVLVAKITPCFENGKGCFTDKIPTQVGFGSTEFHVLRAQTNVDPKYLFYLTTTPNFRSELASEMVGSAGHRRVPFSSVQKYTITISYNKKEQTAIANVLTDMDNDLEALEQRLKKIKQLKQGMMQELLTGRTRLI